MVSCLSLHNAHLLLCSNFNIIGPNYYYHLFSFESFSQKLYLIVSYWSLCDNKSPKVSRTFLSILAGLNNVVVWIVSTRPVISKSCCPCTNPLVTAPRAPITIGTIVPFMFHGFFNSVAKSWYLSLFSYSFNFILWSAGTAKSRILQVLSLCLLL